MNERKQAFHFVAPVFRQVLIAVLDHHDFRRCCRVGARFWRKLRIQQFEDVELELQTHDHVQAVGFQFRDLVTQDLPRRERAGRTVREVRIAQAPASVFYPREHTECGRIRYQDAVRQTDHLRYAKRVLSAERRDDRMVGRVEDRCNELEVLTAVQGGLEFFDGYRFPANDTVLVTPSQTNKA
jgi:hypothetical protein